MSHPAVPPTQSAVPAVPAVPAADVALARTPLHALHVALGARMVPFAGFEMPVAYPDGIVAEHRACREAAALFDVSHMGQIDLAGDGVDALLETLVPQDVIGLNVDRQRYALLTNDAGGIVDDLMVARRADRLALVVNAANAAADLAHLRAAIGARCDVRPRPDRALLALQGPGAVAALSALAVPAGVVDAMVFMDVRDVAIDGVPCHVSRSGYTGEDGFEISLPADAAERLARALLAQPGVRPAGLGARDTLRLEAGLCLHGHDIDATTTPIEAALGWSIQKVRRPGGARAGGHPGAEVVAAQLADGAARRRVGLLGADRIPVREGAALVDADGGPAGRVTSGTVGPSVGRPVAMAYVSAARAADGTALAADVRGRPQPMTVAPMPFVPHRYRR